MDEIAPSNIDVMKIDVEGAEFRVLEGGRKSLERDKPLILMEFSCEMAQRTSGVDPGTALQDMLDLASRLFVLDRLSRQPVAFASAEALLADWDNPLQIEDLLLEPARTARRRRTGPVDIAAARVLRVRGAREVWSTCSPLTSGRSTSIMM